MSDKSGKKLRKELRKIGAENILKKVQESATKEIADRIESRLRAALKPQPKWMPNFIYNWMVQKLIVVEALDRKEEDDDIL